MIIANIGIGALPKHVAERDVRAGLLRQLPPHDVLPAIDIHLVRNPKRKRSEPDTVFLEMLDDLIEQRSLGTRTYKD